jgi:hypothetical protein
VVVEDLEKEADCGDERGAITMACVSESYLNLDMWWGGVGLQDVHWRCALGLHEFYG